MRPKVKDHVRYHKLLSAARERYNFGDLKDAKHLWAKAARLRKRMERDHWEEDVRILPWTSKGC